MTFLPPKGSIFWDKYEEYCVPGCKAVGISDSANLFIEEMEGTC
jgi:hypothetical protein